MATITVASMRPDLPRPDHRNLAGVKMPKTSIRLSGRAMLGANSESRDNRHTSMQRGG
jgi:hypothetical protein